MNEQAVLKDGAGEAATGRRDGRASAQEPRLGQGIRFDTAGARAVREAPIPSPIRRAWLAIEMMLLYVGAPLIVYTLVFGYRIPIFQLLPPFLLLFLLVLAFDRTFSWRQLLIQRIPFRDISSVVALFLVAAPGIALYAYDDSARHFLRFPKHAWDTYLLIMLGYPLLSVPAQELIFRVLFFHRYGPFFGRSDTGRLLAICVSATFFAFAHVIFENWPAFVLSLIGGVVLGARYERTRSFWLVWLEHSLYGNLVFTVGLGRYFYTGVSNL